MKMESSSHWLKLHPRQKLGNLPSGVRKVHDPRTLDIISSMPLGRGWDVQTEADTSRA
jgi:hypothetical protein